MGKGRRRDDDVSFRKEHRVQVRFSDCRIVRSEGVFFSDIGHLGAGLGHWYMT